MLHMSFLLLFLSVSYHDLLVAALFMVKALANLKCCARFCDLLLPAGYLSR